MWNMAESLCRARTSEMDVSDLLTTHAFLHGYLVSCERCDSALQLSVACVLISHTRARLCCCYAAIVSDMWPYLSHTRAEHALMSRARAAILHRNWGTVPPHIGSDTSHSHPRVSRVRGRPGRPSPRALIHPRAR